MADISGVCVVVPLGQNGFRPQVHGMGIVVTRRVIITCAHVIQKALGSDWWFDETPGRVNISFPFAQGECVEGVVSRDLWLPPNPERFSAVSDIAVIVLSEAAPAEVGVARFARPVPGMTVKAYGFRGTYNEGVWVSHPYGQWAVGAVVGPQPGGRAQLDGLRTTGAQVEKGFSGGAVYSPLENTVVGMIAESDREIHSRVAQFLSAPEVLAAIGGIESLMSLTHAKEIKRRAVDLVPATRHKAPNTDPELHAFVGRQREEQQFGQVLQHSNGHIHFVGHGGIGKSFLLKKLASLGEQQGFTAAYIDLAFVQGPLDLVRKLVATLLSSGSCDFRNYMECVNRYKGIEDCLLEQAKLKQGVIYYLSKFRQLVPALGAHMEGDEISLDPASFSSNDSFAVYSALTEDHREFFVNPLPNAIGAFVEDVKSTPIVFEFDRTEKVSRPVGEWLIGSFLPRFEHLITVSAGRDDISNTWGSASASLRVLELGPLSADESDILLRNAGILDQQLRTRIVSTSRGVPLALVLAAEVTESVRDEVLGISLDSYVVDRMINVFLDGIPETRRQALQRLSIFRIFNREAVLELRICDSSTLEAMLKIRFLKHVSYGYAVHDRVRDFIMRDLRRHQPKKYQLLHEEAAEYFHARTGPYSDGNPNFFEWLYHKLSAHPSEAFERVRAEFASAALAIKPEFCEALISVARDSNIYGTLPRLWLRFFEGSIERQRFNFQGANEIYEELLHDSDIDHDGELKAELLYERSVACWYLCRFEEARDLAQTSVILNRSLRKASFENMSLGIVGLSLYCMGQFASATATVQKMARLAADQDLVSRGYALNSVGNFSWHSGHWRRSERAFQESLSVWRALKNPVGECYPLGNMGLLYSSTNRHVAALEAFERGERISRLSGNLEMLAKTLQSLSYHYRRIELFDAAVKFAQESRDIGERMNSVYYVADSMRLLSEAYLDMDDFTAAKRAAAAGLERLTGRTAAYLYLRLKVCESMADVQGFVAGNGNDEDEVRENLVALIGSTRSGCFNNLAAQGKLAEMRLATLRGPGEVLASFEAGANYAFSYNWYIGMDYLERSRKVLLASESMGGLADTLATIFTESRLLQLYTSTNAHTLRSGQETDRRRLSAFVEGV